MEDDSCREDIALGFNVFTLVKFYNFRSHISGGPASEEEVFVDVSGGG